MHRHDVELRIWKAKSRVDVLAARWQMEPGDELRDGRLVVDDQNAGGHGSPPIAMVSSES